MAIKIIREPDVHVSADDLARYRDDYRRDFAHYAGTPPTFESYVRRRQQDAARQWDD